MRKRTFPILLAASAILAGCGLHDPYSPQPRKGTPTSDEQTTQPQPAPKGPADSAASFIARYANVWVNWSATTLPRERAELSALAAGRLADELRWDAAQAVRNHLQEVSQAYSRGRYVGVIRQSSGRAIVVTYEEVAVVGGQAQGAYHVYLAQAEHTLKGWRLIEWQPATDS
jgi:hypothetical protein